MTCGMDDEPKRGRLSTGVTDLLSNVSSVVLLAFAAIMFLAGAIGGISLISRLGGAGWLMYALVIGTYSLVFGPIIASAARLRQRGSPKHRRELEERRQHQRLKFGLHLREAAAQEESADGANRQAPSTSTKPTPVTNGPQRTDSSVTNPGRPPPAGDTTR